MNNTLKQTMYKLVRFLFVSGNPQSKPVSWYGPVVMNLRKS